MTDTSVPSIDIDDAPRPPPKKPVTVAAAKPPPAAGPAKATVAAKPAGPAKPAAATAVTKPPAKPIAIAVKKPPVPAPAPVTAALDEEILEEDLDESGIVAETNGKTNIAPEKKKKRAPVRKQVRAGIIFPVGRSLRTLKNKTGFRRVQTTAGVYATAVVEYLAAELIELAGNSAAENKRKRITPRDITLAITNDDELMQVFDMDPFIVGGGVAPKASMMLKLEATAAKAKRERNAKKTPAANLEA
jgi:histone H2A